MENEPNLKSELQNYAKDVVGQSGGNNPFILNPFTGESTSNPNFLNPLQAVELKLASDPEYAAMIQNLTKMSSIVPTEELANYRDATGNTPPPGTTYAHIQDGGYQLVSPQQNEQVGSIQNTLNALQAAQSASDNLAGGAGGSLGATLQGFLHKIGLGSATPAYNQYQQAVSQVPSQYQNLFGTPGVSPSTDQNSGYASVIQNLQNQLARLNQNQLPPAATSPITPPNLNPYGGTQIPQLNPQQLGANAQKSVGL